MRIGASLFLIAVGAVLKWAVTYHTNGIDLSAVGTILMLVGVIGLVLTLVLLSTRRRTDVIHDGGAAPYLEQPPTYAAPPAGVPVQRPVARTTYVQPSSYDPTL